MKKTYYHELQIKDFKAENNIFLAPMAGVTDRVFRTMCREYGCGLAYTEMISAKGLHYGSKKTFELIDIGDKEKPEAVQIFGSDPDIMAEAAYEISRNDDVCIIDINMGCPAPKIVRNGEGSALMKNVNLASRVVEKVVKSSAKPVTVKIRKGWNNDLINAVDFAKAMEESGASAITVHGRTREEMYSGKADLDIIKNVKAAVSIPVIGNGDITSPDDAERMFEYTGCDAIMIGRGTFGRPWIFKNIIDYFETGEKTGEPSNEYKIDTAIRQLDMMYDLYGERGILEMRKHIGWYLKGLKNSAAVKDMINQITDRETVEALLLNMKENI